MKGRDGGISGVRQRWRWVVGHGTVVFVEVLELTKGCLGLHREKGGREGGGRGDDCQTGFDWGAGVTDSFTSGLEGALQGEYSLWEGQHTFCITSSAFTSSQVDRIGPRQRRYPIRSLLVEPSVLAGWNAQRGISLPALRASSEVIMQHRSPAYKLQLQQGDRPSTEVDPPRLWTRVEDMYVT